MCKKWKGSAHKPIKEETYKNISRLKAQTASI